MRPEASSRILEKGMLGFVVITSVSKTTNIASNAHVQFDHEIQLQVCHLVFHQPKQRD